jgi:hypothetical protein
MEQSPELLGETYETKYDKNSSMPALSRFSRPFCAIEHNVAIKKQSVIVQEADGFSSAVVPCGHVTERFSSVAEALDHLLNV